jgi:hypothetical protein
MQQLIKTLTPKLFRRKAKKHEPADLFLIDFSSKTLSISLGLIAPESRKCSRCYESFPDSSFHRCEFYGYSKCPNCIPAHFCLKLFHPQTAAGTNQFISALLISLFPKLKLSLKCYADATNTHCVLNGFGEADAYPIQRELVKLRDDERQYACEYGLYRMEIEYVGD